ncbi:MAG: hypothetical protein QM755_09115, partial [Luteolibacter sp.]
IPSSSSFMTAPPILSMSGKSLHADTPAAISGTVHGFSGKTDGGRIDYIYASPELKPVDSEILHDSKDGVWPSDHFPVRATLEVEKAK